MCKYKKMNREDLEGLLHLRQRGGAPVPKKGKGSYKRKPKHRGKEVNE